MKQLILLLCTSLLLLFPAGCGQSQGLVIRYDISDPVSNLDPQFATDATARMIIGNIYEGLVVLEPDGEIRPGAAEWYTVSPDGLTYTFTLREGVCWSDGTALTAGDFAFAFQRMFNSDSLSPYATDYLCIRGAAAVLRGAAPGELGIATPDDRTVVFTLEYDTPFFLELLASTPAMPCNREAFGEARGRYGLERRYVYSNGPFTLEYWDNEARISLRKSQSYISELPVLAGGVTLYIGQADTAARFRSGATDLAIVPYTEIAQLQRQSSSLQSFDKTVWCIVFNQNDPALGNALIRQALFHAVDQDDVEGELPRNYTATAVFVPPAMLLLEDSYRDMVGSDAPLAHDVERAGYLYRLGLDSLETQELSGITLYVPDTDDHLSYAGQVQQNWQRYTGLNVRIEEATAAQIQNRFRTGNYQMLLMPFSPASGQIDSLLKVFTSGHAQNYTGYSNPRYDNVLLEALNEHTVQGTAAAYHQAEEILLSDAVVLPLYFETTTYAIAGGVTGIDISPFAGRLYFKYAVRS